ncbi:MAG TPA: hypothetical protein DHV14_01215 [Micrococcales bacterium]|nr:hypothetical protein [Micrococcales bacterium]
MKLAFELYATNNYTFQDIADELTERGLTTRPTARRPAGPISDTKIQQMLRDRYYLGEVTYKGESFKGRHEPLISADLFDHVQRTLDARGVANERRRIYTHYLKGSLWCGHCRLERDVNRRLIQQRTVGRNGGEYWYFFCRGTQDGTCDAPFANIDNIEAAVEEHYKTVELSPEFIQIVRDNLERTLRDEANAELLRRTQLKDRLTSLQAKEDNLLDLAADGSLPQDRIRHRLREIGRERDTLQEQLNATTADLNAGKEHIEVFLDLLTDVQRCTSRQATKSARNSTKRSSTISTSHTTTSSAMTSRSHFANCLPPNVAGLSHASAATGTQRPHQPTQNAHGTRAHTKREPLQVAVLPNQIRQASLKHYSPASTRTVILVRLLWWSIGDSNP